MVNVSPWSLLVNDTVLSGHLPDLAWCPGKEGPASKVNPMGLGIAFQGRWGVLLRVHRDRHKKHLGPKIHAEASLESGHFGGQKRTRIGTTRIDKRDHHDLAAQLFEGQPCAVLRRQAERRRRPDLPKARIRRGLVA